MTTLKFSEAIRLGAMLNPQGFGAYCQKVSRWLKTQEVTCAMGAAIRAGGCNSRPLTESERNLPATRGGIANAVAETPHEWNDMLWSTVACPECERGPLRITGAMHSVIAHLNDTHRWKREKIADWVQTFETPGPEPQSEEIHHKAGVSR